MTCLTLIGIIALILFAVVIFWAGTAYLLNGDIFGWMFVGRHLIETAGALLVIVSHAIASLLGDNS